MCIGIHGNNKKIQMKEFDSLKKNSNRKRLADQKSSLDKPITLSGFEFEAHPFEA